MASGWHLQVLGELRLTRDNEYIKPRTRHDLVLLALLLARREAIPRSDITDLIWPDTDPSKALGYLRNSLGALRKAGLVIERPQDRLFIDPEAVETEISAANRALALPDVPAEAAPTIAKLLLQDAPDPTAPGQAAMDHVRIAWRREIARAWGLVPADHPMRPELASRIEALGGEQPPALELQDPAWMRFSKRIVGSEWMMDSLLRENPEEVIAIIARRSEELSQGISPSDLLDGLLRVISQARRETKDLASCIATAAITASLLTQYTVSERLYRRAAGIFQMLGDEESLAKCESNLGFLYLELRRWSDADWHMRSALDRLQRTKGHDRSIARVTGNLAGVLWHQRMLDEALEKYAQAYALGGPAEKEINRTNYAFVVASFRLPNDGRLPLEEPSDDSHSYRGYISTACRWGARIAQGKLDEALHDSTTALTISTAMGMERLAMIALDMRCVSLASVSRHEEAAGWARAGSVCRRMLGHRRSPGESEILRRWIKGPYFGPAQESIYRECQFLEIPDVARRATRLK